MHISEFLWIVIEFLMQLKIATMAEESIKEKMFRYIWNHYSYDFDWMIGKYPELLNSRSKTQWGNGEFTPIMEACYSGNAIIFLLIYHCNF